MNHLVSASEQKLHIIRAVHIIMSGRIIEGKLTLSREHEGYAWVLMETLSDYELADWLEDYVNQSNMLRSRDVGDNENSENAINHWLKSIENTVNNILGKK